MLQRFYMPAPEVAFARERRQCAIEITSKIIFFMALRDGLRRLFSRYADAAA